MNSHIQRKSHLMESYQSFLPTQTSRSIVPNEHEYYQNMLINSTIKNQVAVCFLIIIDARTKPTFSLILVTLCSSYD
jgi:hypothetical protein